MSPVDIFRDPWEQSIYYSYLLAFFLLFYLARSVFSPIIHFKNNVLNEKKHSIYGSRTRILMNKFLVSWGWRWTMVSYPIKRKLMFETREWRRNRCVNAILRSFIRLNWVPEACTRGQGRPWLWDVAYTSLVLAKLRHRPARVSHDTGTVGFEIADRQQIPGNANKNNKP